MKHTFGLKTYTQIFNFIDEKLYIGDEYDDKSYEEICVEMKKYAKFDFLTHGGIMFDRTKSFICLDMFDVVHIMYQKDFDNEKVYCAQIEKEDFLEVTNEFIKWFDETYASPANKQLKTCRVKESL